MVKNHYQLRYVDLANYRLQCCRCPDILLNNKHLWFWMNAEKKHQWIKIREKQYFWFKPWFLINTRSARTANDVSVMTAFWAQICWGITIKRICFSDVNTTKCESRTSVVLDVGDVFVIRLLAEPPLPVRVIVNDPVRLFDSPVLVGVEVSFRLLLSFHESADNGRLHPFRSRNPIFNIEPFKRNMVAINELWM